MSMPNRIKPNASLDDMVAWAQTIMSREPDVIIGENYIKRWWIIPRNTSQNVYLHWTTGDDQDHFHDHPFDNTSFVLAGGYWEKTPADLIWRRPGDVIHRKATDLHRLSLANGQPSLSLFFTGPVVREWGFLCPKGWRHWQDYTSITGKTSLVGRGCGED